MAGSEDRYSDPGRDRRLARKPRHGPRWSEDLSHAVDHYLASAEVKRMKRFQKVAGVLRSVLSEAQLARVRPVSLRAGTLTLAVADGLLKAELQQHVHHRLLQALVDAGTGVTKVQWRLERSRS